MPAPVLPELLRQLEDPEFVDRLLRPPRGLDTQPFETSEAVEALRREGISVDPAVVERVRAAGPLSTTRMRPELARSVVLAALRELDRAVDGLDDGSLARPWLPVAGSAARATTFGPALPPGRWSHHATVLAATCLLALSLGAAGAVDEHIADFIQTTAAVLALALAADSLGRRAGPPDS